MSTSCTTRCVHVAEPRRLYAPREGGAGVKALLVNGQVLTSIQFLQNNKGASTSFFT